MVHRRSPVVESEILFLLGAEFGLFEENDYETIQRIDFVFVEVVLGNYDVLLANTGAAPGGKGHIWPVGIGAVDDEFGGSFSRYGKKELVLDFGKKYLGFLLAGLIVAAKGKEVANFLIETLFGGPDFADAGE